MVSFEVLKVMIGFFGKIWRVLDYLAIAAILVLIVFAGDNDGHLASWAEPLVHNLTSLELEGFMVMIYIVILIIYAAKAYLLGVVGFFQGFLQIVSNKASEGIKQMSLILMAAGLGAMYHAMQEAGALLFGGALFWCAYIVFREVLSMIAQGTLQPRIG